MTKPDYIEELCAYNRKLDEILLSLNVDEARKFFSLPPGKSDHFVLLTLHRLRYESVQLPRGDRGDSGAWLIAHGYRRMTGEPVRLFHDFLSHQTY